MKKFFTIGEITKPHGVRGEVKVFPLTDDANRFLRLRTVLLEGVPVKVVFAKPGKDRVIMKLEGVDTVEAADALRGKFLEVPREEAVGLERDAYFVEDLKDCHVFDTQGVSLGKVYDVIRTGANDVYWIQEPKELLIPALKSVVVEVSVEEERIVIRPVSEWSDAD